MQTNQTFDYIDEVRILESYIHGCWHASSTQGIVTQHAVTGEPVSSVSSDGVDLSAAVDHARYVGGPALRSMTFPERAALLKAMGQLLIAEKEVLYELSAATGATRADSSIDIEGGAGVLLGYASRGRRELPDGHVLVDGDPEILSRDGSFLGIHIATPRRGVAVQINAFNFPVWGMLEKFAPNFLAGMPCIVKPASATSYLTEAAVRLMHQSGLLPQGSLQLVIGRTGDLLDRVDGQDMVTFTGSASTAAMLRTNENLIKNSVPFNAEADSLNCAILAPDVTPDDVEFDLFVKEVVSEMTVKAGQKCTAIRRVLVPENRIDAVAERIAARLAKVTVGDPRLEGVRMGALASHDQQKDVRHQLEALMATSEVVCGNSRDFATQGEGTENGAFFEPTLLLNNTPDGDCGAHDIEAFGRKRLGTAQTDTPCTTGHDCN